MAFTSYDNLWHFDFHNNISAKDRVQDTNINQIKLRVNDTW